MKIGKMRCHPTIILEKAGGFLAAWIVIIFSQAENIISFFMEETLQKEDLPFILPLLGLLLLAPLLIAGCQFLIWRKTWIYMDGHTLVIERSTLHRKKNTYSIAHISNVNMEQNLFELMVHTCRLKLDMENASDADSTDISILLSLPKAQELKTKLLACSSQEMENPQNTASAKEACASFSQILVHCICSLPGHYLVLFSLLAAFFAFTLLGGEFTLSDLLFEESGSSFFMKALAIVIFILTYGYQLIKRLLAFYHFSACRQGNDIIIHYGFFRKQDYTIPIGRIHGLQMVQAPFARLSGRLEARVVCIGIGDAKEELTQLSLCLKKEDVFQQLDELLPEFPVSSIDYMPKPPKHAWKLYACGCLSWVLLCCLLPYVLLLSLNPPEETGDYVFLSCICLSAACCILAYYLLHYFCLGFHGDGSFAICSGGSLTKTITLVPYSHIQHLCLKENPISRRFGLSHGEIYILASMANRTIAFPYITESEKKLLAEKMACLAHQETRN